MPDWKQLLVSTTGDWTALFSQGGDVRTFDVVGDRLDCRNMRTHYSPHVTRDGRTVSHGDSSLWLNQGYDAVRNIQASFQSRWDWHLYGEPQSFEDLDSYTAPRVPDRFTLPRLNDYCRAIGIERNNEDFYEPIGLLIEQDTSTWTRQPANQMSGAAWRAANT